MGSKIGVHGCWVTLAYGEFGAIYDTTQQWCISKISSVKGVNCIPKDAIPNWDVSPIHPTLCSSQVVATGFATLWTHLLEVGRGLQSFSSSSFSVLLCQLSLEGHHLLLLLLLKNMKTLVYKIVIIQVMVVIVVHNVQCYPTPNPKW